MNLHIMKVLEVSHFNKNGDILYREENLNNILHAQGEEFILKVLFGGLALPTQYYLGLDSRSALSASTSMSDLSSLEPSASGYSRQSVAVSNFSFITNGSGNYQANSPVVLFRAVGGAWGPVRNIFLTTQAGYSGYLVSTVPLGSNLTVQNGEIVSMRIGLALSNS